MILASSVVEKSIVVSACTIGDTSYVVNEDTREITQLNEIGSFLWTEIDSLKSVEEIATICGQKYRGDSEEILRGIMVFFEELFRVGIITLLTQTQERKGLR